MLWDYIHICVCVCVCVCARARALVRLHLHSESHSGIWHRQNTQGSSQVYHLVFKTKEWNIY